MTHDYAFIYNALIENLISSIISSTTVPFFIGVMILTVFCAMIVDSEGFWIAIKTYAIVLLIYLGVMSVFFSTSCFFSLRNAKVIANILASGEYALKLTNSNIKLYNLNTLENTDLNFQEIQRLRKNGVDIEIYLNDH